MRPSPLSVAEIEYIAFEFAKKFMTWNEPIPDFGSRFPNILESCLQAPFARFSRKDLYRGLIGKASILFYLLIKNHPFENGNKRIAVMTLLCFLYKNGYWLEVPRDVLYNFAREVASSDAREKDATVGIIRDLLETYTVRSS